MLEILALEQYSDETLMLLLITVVVGGGFIGFITDIVMGRRGFGPVGNGLLAILGCFFGIYARNSYVGHVFGNELAVTGGMAAATATAFLLIFGRMKHWLTG